MDFIGTIAGLLVVILVCYSTGWHLARFAPFRIRPFIRLWLAPVLGSAAWILFLVPIGWFGGGMASAGIRIMIGVAAAVSVIALGHPRRWLPSFCLVAAFSAAATLPFTLQLLRFGTFDVLNDPWTYMVQSQWFQSHDLSDPVPVDNNHGAQTQVHMSKVTGTRVAAQFLLAAVQSCLGFEWAHDAYPVAICLAFAGGALTLAFAASLAPGKARSAIPILAGLSLTFFHNGFSLGALRGFLPQTFGLSFCTAGCLLFSWASIRAPALGGTIRVRFALLPSLLLAALAYAYSELFPFAVAACGALVLMPLFNRRPLRPLMQTWTAAAIATLLLISPELPRIIRAIIVQSSAVVGCAIPWSPLEFLTHVLGARTGFTDGAVLLGNSPAIATVAGLLVALFALYGARTMTGRASLASILPAVAMLGMFLCLFVHFRYRVASPFDLGVGQSWSQYKLASWSSIFVFALAAQGLATLPRRARMAIVPALSALIAVSALDSWRLAELRTEEVRREIGREHSPFQALVEFATEVRHLAAAPVFLEFSPQHVKSQQLLAYALPAGHTVADWGNDPFVSWMLPAHEKHADRTQARFAINHAREQPDISPITRLANYCLRNHGNRFLRQVGVHSEYHTELSEAGPLNWVRSKITYDFDAPALASSSPLVVDAEIISIIPNLEIDIVATRGDAVDSTRVFLPESLQAWEKPARLRTVFRLPPATSPLSITLTTNSAPLRISDTDNRIVVFLVRNMRVYTSSEADVAAPEER